MDKKKLSIKLGVLVLILAYSLSFFLGHLLLPYLPSRSLSDYLTSPVFLLTQSVFSLFLLFSTLLIAGKQGWRMGDFGFGVGRATVATGIVLGLAMFSVERISYRFLHDYIGESQLQRALVEAAKSEQGLAVMLLVGAVLAPISEELYFRGYMLSALAGKFGAKAGVTLSSLYFAAVHFDARAFLPIFILGVILAIAYAKTRSLTLVITAHMVINSTTFVLSYLGVEV
ncbi:CPBP family intramembrane glutamic endopeptidase [Candidatus Pyrohabitans sp.]